MTLLVPTGYIRSYSGYQVGGGTLMDMFSFHPATPFLPRRPCSLVAVEGRAVSLLSHRVDFSVWHAYCVDRLFGVLTETNFRISDLIPVRLGPAHAFVLVLVSIAFISGRVIAQIVPG